MKAERIILSNRPEPYPRGAFGKATKQTPTPSSGWSFKARLPYLGEGVVVAFLAVVGTTFGFRTASTEQAPIKRVQIPEQNPINPQLWVNARLPQTNPKKLGVRVRYHPYSGDVVLVKPAKRIPTTVRDPGGNPNIALTLAALPEPIPYDRNPDSQYGIWTGLVVRTNTELRDFMADRLNVSTMFALSLSATTKYLFGKRLGRSVDGRFNGDAEQLATDTVQMLYDVGCFKDRRTPSERTLNRGVQYRKLHNTKQIPTIAVRDTDGAWQIPNMVWDADRTEYVLPSTAEQHPNGLPIGMIVRIATRTNISQKARWYVSPEQEPNIVSTPFVATDAPVRNLRINANSLTKTEHDVLQLLGRGLTPKQIANSLGIDYRGLVNTLTRRRAILTDAVQMA